MREDEGALLFEVADDGAGFDLASGAQHGHGFVNMSDRVGAIGGTIAVESAPGAGHHDPRAGSRSSNRPTIDRYRGGGRSDAGVVGPDVADDAGPNSSLCTYGSGAARSAVGGQVGGLVRGEQHDHRGGWAAVIRRVASMPLMPGRLMSMSTSPGWSVGQLDGLLAALGLADHLEPGGGGDDRRAARRNGA